MDKKLLEKKNETIDLCRHDEYLKKVNEKAAFGLL